MEQKMFARPQGRVKIVSNADIKAEDLKTPLRL